MKNSNDKSSELIAEDTLRPSVLAYGFLFAISCISFVFAGRELSLDFFTGSYTNSVISIDPVAGINLQPFIVSVCVIGILVFSSRFFESNFHSIASVKNTLTKILRHLSTAQALALCLVSAVVEELFFRVTLVPFIGVLSASLLYMLLHVSPAGFFSAWSLEFLFSGLILGMVYQKSGSFIAVCIAHFAFNVYIFYRIRSEWSKNGPSAFLSSFNNHNATRN